VIPKLRRFAGWLRRAGQLPTIAAASPASAAPAPTAQLPPGFKAYADYIRIHPTAVIAPTASLKIFNLPSPPRICLEIGAKSHIFSNFAILRAEAGIRIGERCQLGASDFICAEAIDVGDDVLMAWGITLMDNDAHSLDWDARADDAMIFLADYLENPDNALRNKPWDAVPRASITIGSKSWIGFKASILKGVSVGERAIVAAASVVTRSVPPSCVAAGNPARVVHRLSGDEQQQC
jgi:acetyltransferase-like isoleucine patch superfamily enzyme